MLEPCHNNHTASQGYPNCDCSGCCWGKAPSASARQTHSLCDHRHISQKVTCWRRNVTCWGTSVHRALLVPCQALDQIYSSWRKTTDANRLQRAVIPPHFPSMAAKEPAFTNSYR